MLIQNINLRIEKEFCSNTFETLNDNYLLNEYKKCKSVDIKIEKLSNVLINNNINLNTRNRIIEEYILELIPPGTKAVIRGNKFNKIIKEHILNLGLDKERFEISFEKKINHLEMPEIPDWYIFEKNTLKTIIGMNQIDLWGGGQQLNRGFKYIENNKYNTETSKLLCVVCDKVKISSEKNKKYKLFKMGYENDTLCYINGIKTIISKFFK